MAAESLRLNKHLGLDACILAAFSPISVIRGFRDLRFALISTYGFQLNPTPRARRITAKPPMGRRRRHCARSHIKGQWVYTSAVNPYFGAPRRAMGFRGFRFNRSSPIWPPFAPNGQSPTYYHETTEGVTGGGDTLAPDAKYRGYVCILVACIPMLVFRDVPWSSVAFG